MAKLPEAFAEKYSKKRGLNAHLENSIKDLGKKPPQAIDVEQIVLGALMLEKDAISEVVDILRPESFYKDAHHEIYKAIIQLFEASEPIDIISVTNKLRTNKKLEKVGGAFYISELTNRVSSSAHIEHHARIIAEKFILRQLIEITGLIQKDAFDEGTDVFDLLDRTEKSLFDITQGNLKTSYDSMNSLIHKAIARIEEASKNEDNLTGVPSGFTSLDRITSGWQPANLVIVAARPAMGKTSFVLSLARNAAVNFNKPIAFFSLEMSALELVNRLISAEAEIDSMKLQRGHLEAHEWTQLNVKVDKLSEAPIFIDDTPAINIFEFRAKCRRLKIQHDIQLVAIDYLQLMRGVTEGQKNSGNREQEISNISRSLKTIAKELNIPIIALAQLSRAVETRGGTKKPMLSDLRESGSIEQDADQVLFIYRPEYYGLLEDEEGNPTNGIAEIIIAKNRHGTVETVPLKFINQFVKFDNLDDYMMPLDEAGEDDDNYITRSSRMNESDDDQPPF